MSDLTVATTTLLEALPDKTVLGTLPGRVTGVAYDSRKVAAGETYVEEDIRFHEVIGDAAKNELLTTMLAVIWDVLRASREQWLQTNQRAHTSLDAHRRILDALSRHDVDAARTASAEHIRAVGEGILKLLGGRNG